MFKKFKKFYKNNRIYCILMFISLICLMLMGGAVIAYFVNQSTSDKYGNRINNIKDYDLGSSLDDVEKYFNDNEKVNKVTTRVQGKIIYVTIDVSDDLTNENIQSVVSGCLEKLSDENKGFYDIQFIVTRPSFKPYFGSKPSSNTILTWSNYSFDDSTEEN